MLDLLPKARIMDFKLSLYLLGALLVTQCKYAQSQDCTFNNDEGKYYCTEIVTKFYNRFYGSYPLICQRCNLTVFDKNTFVAKNSLKSFNASHSKIQVIGQEAFSNLRTINFLYLEDNEIVNISANAFRGLTEIYEMHLDRNLLTRLTPEFLGGVSANTISLHGNKIGELSVGAFKSIYGVMNLNLSSNGMYVMYPGSFRHLNGLEILDLQQNNLCHIPLGTLQDIPSLRELNLANNRLSKFYTGTFSGLRELVKLNVSHNRLKHFEDTSLLPLIHLINFDISGNQLLYLDPYTLSKSAPTLKYLSVNDNLWTCKQLALFITYMQNLNVDFSLHAAKHYEVPNIHGIVCSDEFLDVDNTTFDKFLYRVTKEYETFTRLSNYC